MRKSRHITLTVIAPAAISMPLLLAGCDEAPVEMAFASPAECVVATEGGTACLEAFEVANKEHLISAPAFASKEDCEAQFGEAACEALPAGASPRPEQVASGQGVTASPSANSGSWFLPLMAGYFLGNSNNNAFSQPYYRTRDGGSVGFSRGTSYSIPPQAFRKPEERERQSGWIGGTSYIYTGGYTGGSTGSTGYGAGSSPARSGSWAPASTPGRYTNSSPGAYTAQTSAYAAARTRPISASIPSTTSMSRAAGSAARSVSVSASRGGFGGSARGGASVGG